MDDTEGDSRYLPNYGVNQDYVSPQHPKVSVRNVHHPHSQRIADNYVNEDEVEEDVEEQEVEAGDHEINGAVQQNGDDVDIEGDDTNEDDDGEDHSRNESVNLQRHPKKRKLKSLLSSFEFAPRLPPAPAPAATSTAKPSFGGRNTFTEWSEHETFVLLESWEERFLKRGRKCLVSEKWQEIAEKVSQESKVERTDSQCRNRVDTLKKKYKKEKALLEGCRSENTNWIYFKRMDMLLSSTPPPQVEWMNPTVYLNRANAMNEIRDSPGNTDSQEGGDDSDFLPPKRSRNRGDRGRGGSFRLLADSINKFSEIYEKIENGKRKQMIELEKMKMDFHRELESQKRQILDRARDEIAKIRQGDHEKNDLHISG